MAWIESHQELARHPKTKKLSRRLGVTVPAAIGHLHMLWWWAIDFAQDGNLSDFDPEDVADAMDWPTESSEQLMQALINSGYVDQDEDLITIHDWFDYAGRLVDRREQNKEKKRKSRAKKAEVVSGHVPVTVPSLGQVSDDKSGHGATVPNSTVPNSTVPNSTKPDQNIKTTGTPAGQNPFKLFESEGFGTLSATIGEKLGDLIDSFGERWVCEAMKEAVVAGKRNLNYVKGILDRFKADGVDDPWITSRKSPRSNTGSTGRSNKPKIEIVREYHKKKEMPESELRGMLTTVHKLEDKAAPTEIEYVEFIAKMRGKELVP